MRFATSASAAALALALGALPAAAPALAAGVGWVPPEITAPELSVRTGVSNPSISWELQDAVGNAIGTARGENFQLQLPQEGGKFSATATAQNSFGDSETAQIGVYAGAENEPGEPLAARLHLLPNPDPTGIARVNARLPRLLFSATGSTGDIVSFAIDTNLEKDTDGDGNPQNDADNKNHSSFRSGELFGAEYPGVADGDSIRAGLTVTNSRGETSTDTAQIQFFTPPPGEPLAAQLETMPPANPEGIITLLPGTQHRVAAWAGASTGDIAQFRIDTNLAADSDSDGKADNDIDNRNHPSFQSGEMFAFTAQGEGGEEQEISLIVVSATSGDQKPTASRVRRLIRFGVPATAQPLPPAPLLMLTTNEPYVGEEVGMNILGLPSDAEIAWDFDGDGTPEKTGGTELSEVAFTWSVPGDFTVAASVRRGPVGEPTTLSEPVFVRHRPSALGVRVEDLPPVVSFTANNLGERRVLFTPHVSELRPLDIAEIPLGYDWDFGGGATSTDVSPEHIFENEGTHEVTLRLTDPATNEVVKITRVITVSSEALPEEVPAGSSTVSPGQPPAGPQQGSQDSGDNQPPTAEPSPPATSGNPPSGPPPSPPNSPAPADVIPGDDGPPPTPSFRIPWGWLFFGLLAALGLGFLGMVITRQQKDPELSFAEAAAEEMHRFFRGHAIVPPGAPAVAQAGPPAEIIAPPATEPAAAQNPAPTEAKNEPEPSGQPIVATEAPPATEAAEEPEANNKGDAPAWLTQHLPDETQPTAEPDQQAAPEPAADQHPAIETPDWLRDDDEDDKQEDNEPEADPSKPEKAEAQDEPEMAQEAPEQATENLTEPAPEQSPEPSEQPEQEQPPEQAPAPESQPAASSLPEVLAATEPAPPEEKTQAAEQATLSAEGQAADALQATTDAEHSPGSPESQNAPDEQSTEPAAAQTSDAPSAEAAAHVPDDQYPAHNPQNEPSTKPPTDQTSTQNPLPNPTDDATAEPSEAITLRQTAAAKEALAQLPPNPSAQEHSTQPTTVAASDSLAPTAEATPPAEPSPDSPYQPPKDEPSAAPDAADLPQPEQHAAAPPAQIQVKPKQNSPENLTDSPQTTENPSADQNPPDPTPLPPPKKPRNNGAKPNNSAAASGGNLSDGGAQL